MNEIIEAVNRAAADAESKAAAAVDTAAKSEGMLFFVPQKFQGTDMTPNLVGTVGKIKQNIQRGGSCFQKRGDHPVYVAQDKKNHKHHHQDAVFYQEFSQHIPVQCPQRKPAAR